MSERRPNLLIFFKKEKKLAMVEQTCPREARLTEAYQEKYQKYFKLVEDLKGQYSEVRQSKLVMGVMGSFENDAHVKKLSELFIEQTDVLNKLPNPFDIFRVRKINSYNHWKTQSMFKISSIGL